MSRRNAGILKPDTASVQKIRAALIADPWLVHNKSALARSTGLHRNTIAYYLKSQRELIGVEAAENELAELGRLTHNEILGSIVEALGTLDRQIQAHQACKLTAAHTKAIRDCIQEQRALWRLYAELCGSLGVPSSPSKSAGNDVQVLMKGIAQRHPWTPSAAEVAEDATAQ